MGTRSVLRLWRRRLILAWVVLCGWLSGCAAPTAPQGTPEPPTPVVLQPPVQPTAVDPGVLAPRATPDPPLPLVQRRRERIAQALQANPPVLLLEGLDAPRFEAQILALNDPRFVANVRAPGGEPLRVEIFGVYPLPASDQARDGACPPAACFRVESYNYPKNQATVALVNLAARRVLDVQDIPQTQPEIPRELADIAVAIAREAPEVRTALGITPGEPLMASTRTALARTSCERSQHLCVAPTFVQQDQQRALWSIVDLTSFRLVGVQWTTLGPSGPTLPPTEKTLLDSAISERYCSTLTPFTAGQWQFDYALTASDGAAFINVRYAGKPVLDRFTIVDWHVSYSRTNNFGYSDGTGCPTFSQSAVPPASGPEIMPIPGGVQVTQEFSSPVWPDACNYYYESILQLFDDGRFRVVASNSGRGCGDDGTYRPVLRIAMSDPLSVAAWRKGAWQPWAQEQWAQSNNATPRTPEGYIYRMTRADGRGYAVEPDHGQFELGRGDAPFVYVTLAKPGQEGDQDLPTLGACCNTDYQQGPEVFISTPPEPITNAKLVFWYVPQLKNDGRPGQEYCWADTRLSEGEFRPVEFPCQAGPMFHPLPGTP